MDFYQWPVERLENEYICLDYLKNAGPRIVRLYVNGLDDNLFAEMPDFVVPTIYGDYHFQGGHRLWHSPESMPRTYIPDEEGLEIERLDDGVLLTQPVEGPTGIRKSMEIRLQEGRPAVTILHKLENAGLWPVELAPWAITQMALGGIAVLPQQAVSDAKNGLLPDRILAVWPYTMINDPRLHLADDLLMVDGLSAQPACKVGILNRRGWIGYLYKGVFFTKRYSVHLDSQHVDYGCNTEVYVDHRFLELESIGPLTRLEPGQSAVHTEVWEITTGVKVPQTPDGVRQLVRDLNL